VSFNSKSLPPPSTEQKRRWELIRGRGCICCEAMGFTYRAPQIHHMTVGGKHGAQRLGHDFTVGLCAWHHLGLKPLENYICGTEPEDVYGPSYALTPRAFRREFGSDEELLRYQNELIGWTKPPVRERLRRNGSPTAKPRKGIGTDARMTSTGRRTLATKGNTKQDGLTREQIGKWLDKRGRKYAPPIKRVKRPEGFRI